MRIDVKQRIDLWLGWLLLLLLKPLARLIGHLARRDHDLRPRGEVVFIKMLGGGNLLLALPALLGLRRARPDLALTLVCGDNVAPFAELIGIFDRIERIADGRGPVRLVRTGLRAWASIVGRRVDTVVDFEVYSILSTIFSLVTGARNRLGFYLENTYWRRNILTHLVFFNRFAPVPHFFEAATRMLGADPASFDASREHLLQRLAPDAHPAPPGLAGLDRYAAVGAGCSDFGAVRQLPPDEWVAFFRKLAGGGEARPLVFVGATADRDTSDAVIGALRAGLGDAAPECRNLCGTLALAESLLVLARAEHYFGVDSALLHAARLLRVPCTSFWGPTHPGSRLVPVPGLVEDVHYRRVLCSPCIHVAEAPPCRGRNICMALFTEGRHHDTVWCEDAKGRPVFSEGAACRSDGA